jgi:hypothetical protein
MDTTYEIRPGYKNIPELSYDNIVSSNNVIFPDYYNNIVREYSPYELDNMVNVKSSVSSEAAQLPSYKITPRGVTNVEPPKMGTSTGDPIDLPDISTTELDEDSEEDLPDSPF